MEEGVGRALLEDSILDIIADDAGPPLVAAAEEISAGAVVRSVRVRGSLSTSGPPRNSPLALASSQRTAALVNGLIVAGRGDNLDSVVRCRTVIAGLSS